MHVLPRHTDERRHMGVELASAMRHDEVSGCAQKKDKEMPDLVRSVAAAEHNEVANGDEMCSGGVRSKSTTGFRWVSDESGGSTV